MKKTKDGGDGERKRTMVIRDRVARSKRVKWLDETGRCRRRLIKEEDKGS